jgi:hypothetical protein
MSHKNHSQYSLLSQSLARYQLEIMGKETNICKQDEQHCLVTLQRCYGLMAANQPYIQKRLTSLTCPRVVKLTHTTEMPPRSSKHQTFKQVFLFFSARNWTQGLMHSSQGLWVTAPAFSVSILDIWKCSLPNLYFWDKVINFKHVKLKVRKILFMCFYLILFWRV